MRETAIDPTKTRKDAVTFEVTDANQAIGYYLARTITKKWVEDYVDSSTGEAVSINREDIVKRRGELITPPEASSLNFLLQTGEIETILVSDQRRQATERNHPSLKPYRVTALINRKRHQFILEAQTVELALEVTRDWIELNYKGDFIITGASALFNVVLLNGSLERFTADGETQEIMGTGETDGETTRYYKADAEVTVYFFGEEDPREQKFTFIVKTLDVDTAKAAATAWIASRIHDNLDGDQEVSSIKTTLISAVPFSCAAIINRAFCEAYRTNDINQQDNN